MNRKIVLLALFPFALSLLGADTKDEGCAPAPTHTGQSAQCAIAEDQYYCKCTVHYPDPSQTCSPQAIAVCAPDGANAQQRAGASIVAKGYSSILCNCALAGAPAPISPQTIGGDPPPMCSDLGSGTTGAGGSTINPTCGQPSDVCDTGIDCCSGICTLSACE